jgi:hypothetical protein
MTKRCCCAPVVGFLLEQLYGLGEVGGWRLDLGFLVDQRTPNVSIHCLSSLVLDVSLSEIVSDHILPSFTDTRVKGPLRFGVEQEHCLLGQRWTSIGIVHAIDMAEPSKSVPSHDVDERRLSIQV